ncbi:O-antigen polymerase [Sphingomonas phyllosphaerae]|uniref:O-antigen polymerase n=1 Tax=Sphingomonas phyllosphaerae TaxID=257003 RepID=UPI00055D9155|nr:O-antigen polymerase [Sphingomonas phyllosphaerae]
MAGSTPNRLSEYLPMLAFVAAWALQIVYFVGYDSRIFFTYGFGVLSLVLLAVGSYVTGYFACKIMPLGKAIADPPVRTLSDIRATTILMQVTIVMAAILVTANILLPLARGISLSTARELALEAWENGGVLPRIVAVAVNVTISFSLMMIVDRIDIKGRFPFLLVLLFVALTIAAYSRAHLLMGLSIISTKWISQSKYRLSFIFFVFVLFAGLFSILSVITSVGSADRGSGIEDILKSVEVYAFGGVAGFEFYYTTGFPQYASLLTIPRFMYYFIPGIGVLPPSYFPFIDTVPPINVFSALYPPFHDFGATGLAGFFLLYGFISALVAFLFQRRPNRYLCILSGFLLYAALMSPFDDQYIRGLTILILMLTGAALYGFIRRAIRAGLG